MGCVRTFRIIAVFAFVNGVWAQSGDLAVEDLAYVRL
jgi:hypothetical protein